MYEIYNSVINICHLNQLIQVASSPWFIECLQGEVLSSYDHLISYMEIILIMVVVVVQSLSCVQLFATPWTAAHQASLSITNSWSLLKLMSIELVMPSNHLIICHPLLLMPSVFPSIRVFSNESVLHIRWPKYWSFSFSISPSNEYSGLISFRMDWLECCVSFRYTIKWLSYTYTYIHSFLRYIIIEYWVELSVLYSRSLLIY